MTVAAGNPKVASRANAEPAAVMGAGITERLIGFERLVLNIRYDIRPVRDALQVIADLEPHDNVAVALFKVGFAAIAAILH